MPLVQLESPFSENSLGCFFLDHSCYTSNQVVNMEAPFNFFDFVWEVLLKVSQMLIYNSSKGGMVMWTARIVLV